MSSPPPSDATQLDAQLDDWIVTLPKAELHVHLEGSILPELALKLAERRGVRLPGVEAGVQGLRERYRFQNFRDFLNLYVAISSCLCEAEDFRDAVIGVAAELKRNGVVYAESTFTPMTHVARGVDPDAMLAGLAEGREEARRQHGVDFAWVFDIVRSLPDQGEMTLDLALAERARGVIALGVGGPEGPRWPAEPLVPYFERAKAEGLKSLPHAGEQDGPQSVWDAIRLFGADRIGHGVRATEDANLVDYLREHQLPLEVCPSSNVALGLYPDFGAHVLPRLREEGLAFSLASDDPPLFGTTLVDEYRRVHQHFGWTREELRALAGAAVEHSFLPAHARDELQAAQAAH